MASTDRILDRLHLKALKQLFFVHESLKWEGPSVTDCLEVLHLMNIDVKSFQSVKMGNFRFSALLNERLCDTCYRLIKKDIFAHHVFRNKLFATFEVERSCVNVELWVRWLLVRV